MPDAASVVVDVLREHVSAGGHVDHMTGAVSVKCKACQEWIPDSGEHRGGFKAHVAAAVVDALGGLSLRQRYRVAMEDGKRSQPMSRLEQAQVALDFWADSDRPWHHIEHERRWVSGWVREPAEGTP